MSERLAVLGAGTMGHGIAQVAAQQGFAVTLYDVAPAALATALERIGENLAKGVHKAKLSAADAEAARGRISTTHEVAAAVRDAQVVIEAAPERLDLKTQLFAEVCKHAPAETLLGTNTSSLSVTQIAAACTHPARVVGLHFFNPPYALKLMEIVRAEQTSPDTVARAQALGQRLGREMVVVSDVPGFATSRLGLVLGLEAIRMVEQGVASPADIDRAMELGYGHPMGPLRLTDLVGLDVRLAIADYLHHELGEQFRAPPLLRRLVRAGKLGKKSGEGFYRW